MQILSWNVNGIRAISKKGFLEWMMKGGFDIVCLQETKFSDINVLSYELINPPNYNFYYSCSLEKKGYSGVAVYTKIEPEYVKTDFGDSLLSKEGRVIELGFKDFVLLNIYFPNGGQGPIRLDYKLKFYDQFLNYINELTREGKNVVFCGDVNTAHKEIDLARPKQNRKTSGFMPIECDWLDKFVDNDYLDTFRIYNSGPDNYTWWDYKTKSRERNTGWRIDYFYVHKKMKAKLKDAFILNGVFGSDHCPVGIELV